MPTVACPLSGCSSEHELKHARNKRATPFFVCNGIGGNSTIWVRTPGAESWISNGGGAIENPESGSSVDYDVEPLPRRPHPNFRPRSPSPSTDPGPARCGSCGAIVTFGVSPCPRCQTPLTWEDEDVDPDLGI